jgi:hypothetical protein
MRSKKGKHTVQIWKVQAVTLPGEIPIMKTVCAFTKRDAIRQVKRNLSKNTMIYQIKVSPIVIPESDVAMYALGSFRHHNSILHLR